MSVWRRGGGVVVTALVGLGSGLLGAALYPRLLGSTSQSPRASAAATSAIGEVDQPAKTLAEFRAPIVIQPSTACSADGAPDAAKPAREPQLFPQDKPEGQIAIEQAEQEKRLLSFRQEPRDAAWAAGQEKQIRGGFAQLGAAFGGALRNVECHSVSCAAEVEWKTMADAQQQAGEVIIGLGASVGCFRSLVFGSDKGGALTPAATLVVDCTSTRYPNEQDQTAKNQKGT